MAKVILICGKICSGKSTYAQQLCRQNKAVLLSIDEIMLSVLGPYLGDQHDLYSERTQKYLFDKSLELIEAGIDVVLDWGFWTKEKRESAKAFYEARSIPCELHYIEIGDEVWRERIKMRNDAVSAGEISAYFVDENLAAKVVSRFEVPGREEIDVWIEE